MTQKLQQVGAQISGRWWPLLTVLSWLYLGFSYVMVTMLASGLRRLLAWSRLESLAAPAPRSQPNTPLEPLDCG